jgi:hypothetical protein
MDLLSEEIRKLSLELKHMAEGDEDVKLLMTIPGIGYYWPCWSKLRLETSAGSA